MIQTLSALWRGQIPLIDAFWNYLAFWGVLINVIAFLAGLAFFVLAKVVDASGQWASALTAFGLAIHFSPLPYNAVAAVGVWRSAGRADSHPFAAAAARAAAVIFFAVAAII